MNSRTNRRNVFIYLLFALLNFQSPVWGTTVQDLFNQGVEAFRNQNYQVALDYFERAQEGGLDNAKLYYNLGVTNYKLERYKDSENAFLKIVHDPDMEQLATYNLGLVALKQGNTHKAERLFRKALAINKSNKLALLSAEQLKLLGFDVPMGGANEYPGFAMVRGSLGYDDNVILQADVLKTTTSNQGDAFFELFLFGSKEMAQLRNKALQIQGSLYSTRYSDLSAYNLDDLNIGVALSGDIGQWGSETGISEGATYIDGNGLNRTTTLKLGAERKFSQGNKLHLRYSLNRIDEIDKSYSYLAGWLHQVQIDSTLTHGSQNIRFTYRFEYNDRKDLLTPRFTSYSPTRHILRLRSKFPISNRLNASVDLRYRYSHYKDASEQLNGSFIKRTDNRYRIIVRGVYSLGKHTDLTGEYSHTKNISNLSSEEYTRNRYQIYLAYIW